MTIRRKASIVPAQDALDVPLQAGEELGVEDHAVLDDLGQAAPQLAVRQGPQGFGVDPDAGRLIKRADDVLGVGMIDPDLAADRAVDLGEQGRRHHDQGKPAGERGRDKAGEVADHAAPQGDDQRVAIGLATAPARRKAATPGRATWSPRPRERPRPLTQSQQRTRRPGTRREEPGSARWESVTTSADRHDDPDHVRSSASRTNGPKSSSRPVTTRISYERGPSSTSTRDSGAVELVCITLRSRTERNENGGTVSIYFNKPR